MYDCYLNINYFIFREKTDRYVYFEVCNNVF